jgi:hypothetical protein
MPAVRESRILVTTVLTLVLAASSCVYSYQRRLNGPPIRSDGLGYYAYLSTIFIDHDLSFRAALANNPGGVHREWEYGIGHYPVTGKMFDSFYPDTALLGTPFFLITHLFAKLFHSSRTGYSTPYQVANIASGIFSLGIGMLALYAMLRRRPEPVTAFMTLFLVVFATNVFHYATYDASFGHIYSFVVIAIYALVLDCYRDSPPGKDIFCVIALGVLMGLIILTRSTNAILGLPLIGLILEKAWKAPTRLATSLLASGSVGFLTIFPLLAYWHETTGSWIVNSYAQGGAASGFFIGRSRRSSTFCSASIAAFFSGHPLH